MRMTRRTFGGTLGAGGLLAIALWFASVTWFTDAGIRRFERQMRTAGAPAGTGETWRNERFFVDPDSYYWLAYARELRETGGWRLRRTLADNAPYGREMHWSHLVIWSLMGTARWIEAATGANSAQALELAGRALMPAAGFIFLGTLFVLLGRRHGWLVSGLAIGGLATSVELLWNFHGLRPDHNGFQLAFAAGMWLCLALGGMGQVQRQQTATDPGDVPDPRIARRWFLAAGLLGGAALWTGATVFLFSLCATAAGAVFARISASAGDDPADQEWDPNLWRLWAVAGSLVGLGFYALEYAPTPGLMRLEVNHPLYTLCWLGTGECLRTLFSWPRNGARSGRKTLAFGLGGLVAAAALPLLILFGPVAAYWPRSEIMLRLHSHHVLEFRSLLETSGGHWLWAWIKLCGVGTLAVFGVAWMLGQTRRAGQMRPALAGLWVVSVFFTGLYFWQVRWAAFALVSSLLLGAFWLAALRETVSAPPTGSRCHWLPPMVALLFAIQILVGVVHVWPPLIRLWRVETMDGLWFKALLQRNLMVQLREAGNGAPLRLMAPAEMVPAISYFGVGDSVGSLYWENPAGLAAAAAFFGDPLPGNRAREIARERGITHALIDAGAADALMFTQLATGRQSQEEAALTVGGALAQSGSPVPAWLTPDELRNPAANRTYEVAIPLAGGWVPAKLPVQIYRVKP